jgi:hypothetical protein
MRAIIGSNINSLFVVLNDFINYYYIFFFDFILKFQLLEFKLAFKCKHVLLELVLKVLKSIFKFLEVIFVRGEHAFETVHHSVYLDFDVGTK